jgi:hypothetical protein
VNADAGSRRVSDELVMNEQLAKTGETITPVGRLERERLQCP